MPSDLAYWMIAVPIQNNDPHQMMSSLSKILLKDNLTTSNELGPLNLPPFKAGTLDSLINLSEELPRVDNQFTQIVAKIVDTLRNLLNNDAEALGQHIQVNEQSIDDYLLSWTWNGQRYRTDRSIREIVDTLTKEITSIDNVMKNKLNSYNMAKGQLQQIQRRRNGNLSTRALGDVVHRNDIVDPNSEYLETLIVAVPSNNVKDWQSRYERLTDMVVPRSSNKLASDEEYALFNVTVFKKVKEEFSNKCRENKFVIRDFRWEDNLAEQQKSELDEANVSEKELWTELLRLARTNFSEAYMVLTHVKVIRTFVESVLRFGLPAEYFGIVVKPNPKRTKALLSSLTSHFSYLETSGKKGKGNSSGNDDAPGEYAAYLEQEQYPFVLTEQFLVAA